MFKFGNLLLRIHYFQMLQNLFWNTKTFKMRPSILEDMIDEKCKLQNRIVRWKRCDEQW